MKSLQQGHLAVQVAAEVALGVEVVQVEVVQVEVAWAEVALVLEVEVVQVEVQELVELGLPRKEGLLALALEVGVAFCF